MKFYNLLLITLISTSGHAVNIRDALASAYKNNQELLATRESMLAAHEKIVQAKGGFRPEIKAGATASVANSKTSRGASSPTVSSKDKNRKGNIVLTQNIFRGFADAASVSKTEHDIMGQWAQLKSTEQEIFLKVIKAYLDLYAKYASVEVYKANFAFMQKNYEAAKAKREIGEETITQESLAEAKYVEAQSKLQLGLADLEGAKASFEQLTGLAAPERVEQPKELLEAPQSMDLLQEVALRENPKIKQAQEDISSAKQNKKVVTGKLLPSLDFQAASSQSFNKNSAGTNNVDSITNPTRNQRSDEVSLNLTVPLYDAGVTRSQYRETKKTIVAKRIAFEKVRQEIIQSCKQMYMAFVAIKSNMQNSSKQVKAQEIAVDGVTQEMQVGTKILVDVLNAQAQLLQAKLDQINTIQQYYFYLYQILSLQGKLTAEGLGLPVEVFRPEENYTDIKNSI
ncbi:MAG: TolC family outer membrane protein [Pseudomonadota bacterium]|jgi:outer membrane protein|nr:TolC family outer membrane protein [Alphaproteobacteria bacterium]